MDQKSPKILWFLSKNTLGFIITAIFSGSNLYVTFICNDLTVKNNWSIYGYPAAQAILRAMSNLQFDDEKQIEWINNQRKDFESCISNPTNLTTETELNKLLEL